MNWAGWVITVAALYAGVYIGTIIGMWIGWRITSKRYPLPGWSSEPFNWRLIWPGLYWRWYDQNVKPLTCGNR